MWTSDKFSKISCKSTASLLTNNLSYNGRLLAFVHDYEVNIEKEGRNVSSSVTKIQDKDNAPIMQVRWFHKLGTDYLVVAGVKGVQVPSSALRAATLLTRHLLRFGALMHNACISGFPFLR